ncbi:hypothetical protein F511_32842 [Dorcoceras hygrometricum]|uniref:Uncharacterized protein n=1 Tax=Dorcoceras hygrometricum TaxID=472368 RepID=A0A2Z7C6X4_9LAMI|nr:hypothetical protein F511_32842 [Dorcoceras hygrometricum]
MMQLSCIKHDLEEMEFIMSVRQGSLTEQLLPSRNSFFVCQLRSGVRHTNILLRGTVFRIFSINWFTYGFPISLFALSYWSFHFASMCAFGLLAYVGYILYAFPSLFRMHRLNGLLLVFILLWAVSTYVFNVAFAYVNWKLGKDMEIWELIGLWHYPVPGFFLLAQFFLGVLVAIGNLVNNSVFLCLSNEERQTSNENETEEVKKDAKVLIVATVAWGLRKCSRPIMMLLMFLIAMKPGFIHAVYVIFFFVYLLSHNINKGIRQSLILLCEAHFAILYILQLNLISRRLERKGSIRFLESDSSWDFLQIALLACFCAIHNRGFEMLFSFSAIVRHTPCHPIGFSILRAGLNKSVLLSVYASSNIRDNCENSSDERKVALYLGAVEKKFLSMYRSFGTYISFLTILLTVYTVRPNYTSFGYIFLLLVWIIGRQLVEKTKSRLWFPLKVYAISVFIFIYILSIFPTFEAWISTKVDLNVCLGYDTEATLLRNLWESLAIMIVMQLYSYERRRSKKIKPEDHNPLQSGILGFTKRFLIWHGQKILHISLFYASLSPISAFGFLYLLGLVVCSALPKDSRIPSKLFLIYTGFLVEAEYLYQMWGKYARMFPGQKHYNWSLLLGLQVYKPSFEGLEAGLRGKVLVIAACTLQYNVFQWLEKIPGSLLNGRSKEACPLFFSPADALSVVSTSNVDEQTFMESNELSAQKDDFSTNRGSHDHNNRKYLFGFEMQKTTLKVYLKFWMENMFNLFGLEINMIALLLASFALLNAISMLYIACLATCVLLPRPIVRRLWLIFVFLFATILLAEYIVMWKAMTPLNRHVTAESAARCHDCWKNSYLYFHYCEKCWLGLTVDDPRMLISYYAVFMIASFKVHADHASCFSGSFTYYRMVSHHKNAIAWLDLSFETKSMWTLLDYFRVYCYCHLLDLVLASILITGTLEYDILHLGYLGFALVFFRLRLTILKKKNKIFKYLRMYNFAVIVLSLAYQSPFVGDFNAEKCETVDYIYEVIGFYKYDYGFRITSRSALVEIIIFFLVSLQSYMFSLAEFDYVFRYLEAEQIGAIVREQEKKAAWKTEQLQHIRRSEEEKRQRNLQVEKMKSEMLNLQIQLHSMNSLTADDASLINEGLRRRRNASLNQTDTDKLSEQDDNISYAFPSNVHDSPSSSRPESPITIDVAKYPMDAFFGDITEQEECGSHNDAKNLYKVNKGKTQSQENPLASAVQLIGDGVSQVQSIGNQAVNSLVSFLNIVPQDSDTDSYEPLCKEGLSDEKTSSSIRHLHLNQSSSLQSDRSRTSDFSSLKIGRILEDINASLYLVKCDNILNRAKHKQGEKQTKMTKICNGICLFFILICVIWTPMLIYSSGNPTNIANPINDASFQFDIKTMGGRLTLYQTTLCEKLSWNDFFENVDIDPEGYLSSYNVNDIQLVCCQADASTMWLVPDVVQKQFISSLNSSSMDIKFSWVLTRDRPKGKETVKYERSVDPSYLPKTSEVERVLKGSFSSFRVSNIYPRYFRVTGSGEVRPFEQEVNDVSADLVLHHGSSEWWSFHDINSFDKNWCGGLTGPMAVIVSEETPQGFLGETLSKFSIWGLYITFVLAVGRFIRMQCSDLRMRIPYENLPSCDRLIAICEDIYAARAEGELGVEEVLYWTLVKIYRSPHMLLEYTNPD